MAQAGKTTRASELAKVSELAAQLREGKTTARDLVEQCLDRIARPDGEGSRVYIKVDAQSARDQADEADRLRSANRSSLPNHLPLAGIPISVKDLFDIQGQVTRAGSKILEGEQPAKTDAPAIGRLRDAGLVIVGRTNMTEFAYSGLGLNPHFGTPRNPSDREIGRIPGGSSSGAAVSVTDNMAVAGIGTDTGGSCRIPAAFCGITGYKPTARRIPLEGAFPLSHSFDSIGPLAKSVDCCFQLDAIMAGEAHRSLAKTGLARRRIGVLQNYVLDGVDSHVARTYETALTRLTQAGAELVDLTMPFLDELPALNARGGIVAAEAYKVHSAWLESSEGEYDPRVSARIKKGMELGPDEYQHLLAARGKMIAEANIVTADLDVIIFPSVPIVAPTISSLEDESEYGRINMLALRNPTVANLLDRCAISMPIHTPGTLPVGLMVMGESMSDHGLFEIAAAIEQLFRDAH